MKIEIAHQSFSLVLEDNATVRALAEKLPMIVKMSELNGNEKYYYLDETLPAAPQYIGQIKAGDIMLFGNDCLVVFYKSFKTSYSYTRIGHIENADDLEQILGRGSVNVSFLN